MTTMPSARYGDILFVSRERSRCYSQPEAIITCTQPEAVVSCIAGVDAAIREGRHAAGFISYEAGWALMGRPLKRRPADLPLLWFGLYRDVCVEPPPDCAEVPLPAPWCPAISREHYDACLARIRAYIEAGDTYQVNYTFPFHAPFSGDGARWFSALYAAQPTDHAAYLDLGRFNIISLSPELFFEVDGDRLITRPMKGTRRRAPFPEADQAAAEALAGSIKDRAENLMIVDLLRNDMGRISDIGSVKVERLFDVERYATVWQMTSTITSRSNASFAEMMTALFPCGSVTGAPKIRTMEIIEEVETYARGAYCGAIGWWGPNRQASFNVAIRTITLDTERQSAEYPVGGGITWESRTDQEYEECLTKAMGVSHPGLSFELLESLLYEDGFFLLEEHLDRLCASAAYFDIPLRRDAVRSALLEAGRTLANGPWKVRLLVNRRGERRIDIVPAPPARQMRVALAAEAVSRENLFLYHKTTRREHYEQALAGRPGADDVLLWNEEGELTETTRANIVARVNGELVTPPVACGLLPGVMRAEMLRRGEIREQVIPKSALPGIEELFLINSVRKKIPARLCGDAE